MYCVVLWKAENKLLPIGVYIMVYTVFDVLFVSRKESHRSQQLRR